MGLKFYLESEILCERRRSNGKTILSIIQIRIVIKMPQQKKNPPFFNITRIRVPNYIAKQRGHHEKTSGLYCILIEKPRDTNRNACWRLLKRFSRCSILRLRPRSSKNLESSSLL